MSDALEFDNGMSLKWPEAVDTFKTYAKAQSPREACALILENGALVPAANLHEEPERAFLIDPEAWTKGEAVAVLHSHTPGPDRDKAGNLVAPLYGATKMDVDEQIKTALPWGIVLCDATYATDVLWFGDQVPTAPLYQRPFINGIWDCYSLIRDWHKDYGITLYNEGRDDEWWLEPDPRQFYSEFERAGFKRVIRGLNPIKGDVFITHVHSPVPNHAGIYIGDGMIAHHLNFMLSMRTPAVRWQAKMDFFVRHQDLPEDI